MATAGELIKRARFELHDPNGIEYTDEELLHYLADAVSLLSRLLIQARSTHSIRETWLTVSPNPLPEKFVAMAEYEPKKVKIRNNSLYSRFLPVKLKYYIEYTRPDRTNFVMDVPFVFEPVLSQMITARALNRNEFNTAVERKFIEFFTEEIIKISRQRDGLITNAEREPRYVV